MRVVILEGAPAEVTAAMEKLRYLQAPASESDGVGSPAVHVAGASVHADPLTQIGELSDPVKHVLTTRAGPYQALVTRFVDEALAMSLTVDGRTVTPVTARPGRTTQTPDGFGDYLRFHMERVGTTMARLDPRPARLALWLSEEEVADSPHAVPRAVNDAAGHRVFVRLDGPEKVDAALELIRRIVVREYRRLGLSVK